MGIDVEAPKRNLYLSENEVLMDRLVEALAQKLDINPGGIAIGTHFLNAATEEYLESNHFRICLDHTYSDRLEDASKIARGFGLKGGDVSVSLGSVFLAAQAEPVIEDFLDIVSEETGNTKDNGNFGSYGVWGVMQRPHFYVPRPSIVMWYNDASDLGKVVQSDRIPECVEIDNKHGAIEIADVLHVFKSPKWD